MSTDPAAPKRASNAYMIFCKERRARLKEERPDLPFGKLGATLGELWRTLSQDEKKPYELRASGDPSIHPSTLHFPFYSFAVSFIVLTHLSSIYLSITSALSVHR
jgi:hypothetical protein